MTALLARWTEKLAGGPQAGTSDSPPPLAKVMGVGRQQHVLGMSVVRGMREVGGVCEMCMCFALGGVGGEGGLVDERIGFRLYQSCGNRGSGGRVFGLRWCGYGACPRVWRDGVVFCLCESGFFV